MSMIVSSSTYEPFLLLPSDLLEVIAPPFLFFPRERTCIAGYIPSGNQGGRIRVSDLMLVAGPKQRHAVRVARPPVFREILVIDRVDQLAGMAVYIFQPLLRGLIFHFTFEYQVEVFRAPCLGEFRERLFVQTRARSVEGIQVAVGELLQPAAYLLGDSIPFQVT